ncbi:hypothetical protein DB42_BK00210 [Neochlamydia sp. EPS4]|nr:hypothetical protein DB42_BK00210 [Neochlamydia sp. EPS4]
MALSLKRVENLILALVKEMSRTSQEALTIIQQKGQLKKEEALF